MCCALFSVLFCLSLSCVWYVECCQCLWIDRSWFPLRLFSNVYLSKHLFITDIVYYNTYVICCNFFLLCVQWVTVRNDSSFCQKIWAVMKGGGLALYNLIQPTISLEMPVPSQGHYGFQFSGCWLILSVYILMSFDFPFVRSSVILLLPLFANIGGIVDH
jgi:hypothetical protein